MSLCYGIPNIMRMQCLHTPNAHVWRLVRCRHCMCVCAQYSHEWICSLFVCVYPVLCIHSTFGISLWCNRIRRASLCIMLAWMRENCERSHPLKESNGATLPLAPQLQWFLAFYFAVIFCRMASQRVLVIFDRMRQWNYSRRHGARSMQFISSTYTLLRSRSVFSIWLFLFFSLLIRRTVVAADRNEMNSRTVESSYWFLYCVNAKFADMPSFLLWLLFRKLMTHDICVPNPRTNRKLYLIRTKNELKLILLVVRLQLIEFSFSSFLDFFLEIYFDT